MSIEFSSGKSLLASPNHIRAGIIPTLVAALLPTACTSVDTKEVEAQRQREIVEALYSKFDQELSDNLNFRLAHAVAQALNKLSKDDLQDLVRASVKDVVPGHVDLERDKLVKAIASEIMSRIAQDNKLSGVLSDWRSDPAVLRRTMLQPSVQISLGSNIGSGVILQKCAESTANAQKYYVLTCWHTFREHFAALVKDTTQTIIDLSEECMTGPEIHVKVYASGRPALESARIIYADPARDLAILQLETEYDLPTAKFDMNRRDSNLSVLSPVMIVGCPLGNDPIPTTGMISEMNHQVEQKSYFMTTAPAHIGNSGGAIFSLETGEVEGIFVKVYMAGASRPNVVSHMGLGVKREVIHDFLLSSGLPEFDLKK